MNITVYTCILDGFDHLRPPMVVEPGVRYLCYSDVPLYCPPWEIQPAFQPYSCPSRNSRIPKILSHLHTDTEYSIWHDGCFVMMAKPSDLIAEFLANADIAMYRHPCRHSILEELECCERLDIGYSEQMVAQVERYRGHGVGEGLWSGGVILRRHTDLVKLLNGSWWREYLAGSTRDQISFVFTRHSVGLQINTIDANILQDVERFAFHWHAAFINRQPAAFELERKKRRVRIDQLRELCV